MAGKIFLVLFSVLCILLISCSQNGITPVQQAQNPDSAKVKCDYDDNGCNKEGVMCKVSPPLAIKLCFLEDPILNKPVKLIYKFRYDRGYQDRINETVIANATIYIPKGFSLVEGNTEWKGNLAEKEDKEIEVTVKAMEKGYYQVGASVSAQDIGGVGNVVYLNITQDKADILTEDEWLRKEGAMESATGTPIGEVK